MKITRMRAAKAIYPEIAIGREPDHQFVSSRSRQRRGSLRGVKREASGVPWSEAVSMGILSVGYNTHWLSTSVLSWNQGQKLGRLPVINRVLVDLSQWLTGLTVGFLGVVTEDWVRVPFWKMVWTLSVLPTNIKCRLWWRMKSIYLNKTNCGPGDTGYLDLTLNWENKGEAGSMQAKTPKYKSF